MTKKEFIKLLKKAKTDERGNLYIERKDIEKQIFEDLGDIKNYFCLVETVCADFAEEYVDNKDSEYYDRHFTENDDTLTITMIKEK